MRYVSRFLGFWYAFVVGDDWLVAAGTVLALGLSGLLAHEQVPAWWLMPVAAVALLALSLVRAVRRGA